MLPRETIPHCRRRTVLLPEVKYLVSFIVENASEARQSRTCTGRGATRGVTIDRYSAQARVVEFILLALAVSLLWRQQFGVHYDILLARAVSLLWRQQFGVHYDSPWCVSSLSRRTVPLLGSVVHCKSNHRLFAALLR